MRTRNSQERQEVPKAGPLLSEPWLSRTEGDRCFMIPIALIVHWFGDGKQAVGWAAD